MVVPNPRLSFTDMAKSLISMGAQGLVVGGACMGEDEVTLLKAIASVRDVCGPDVPVVVQGVRSLTLVRHTQT